jgi:hypothetical protein
MNSREESQREGCREVEISLRAEVEYTLASDEIRREDAPAFRRLLKRLAEIYGEELLDETDEVDPVTEGREEIKPPCGEPV